MNPRPPPLPLWALLVPLGLDDITHLQEAKEGECLCL